MRVVLVAALMLASGLLLASTVEANGPCAKVRLPVPPNTPMHTVRDARECSEAVQRCALSSASPATCLQNQLRA